MSYRSIKRLLGETSLERKCRFLFGGGLMLLISGSFYFYAQLTATIIEKQNKETAQLLVAPIIMEKHLDAVDVDKRYTQVIKNMASTLKPDEFKNYRWRLLKPDPVADSEFRTSDFFDDQVLPKIRNGEEEIILHLPEEKEYRYYAAVHATKSCLSCHYHSKTDAKIGEVIGMVKITLPLDKIRNRLATNNAILLAMAIVTSFLAMIAAYAIVRYVIVKPVLHLKEVSDEIAKGSLNLRANIRTGDEFEELSHAFNRMLRHLVTVQDELKQANSNLDSKVDELARANLSLFEMNKLKNEFLATMSHELRTPLNSILGFSDVLNSAENLNENQKRYLSNISTSGHLLLAMINDILDLAKIESGKMEIHAVEFSIAELMEELCSRIAPLADRKNIELKWTTSPEIPPLYQDMGKIQQILTNLLSNAVKFTPDGGRVRVEITSICLPDHQQSSEYIQISVADTGIGIPLADQERIFEKFRQASTTPGQEALLTREYEGTGLGLSIVMELSKLLGGEVTLESEFGKGSVFTVRLPQRVQPVTQYDVEPNDALEYQTLERTRQRAQQLISHHKSENNKPEENPDSTSVIENEESKRDAG